MKRCPQCDRTEPDDSLAFCRADGAALVSDSGSAPPVSEIETSILPHRTDADMNRPTAPTTVLPAQSTSGTTRELSRPKWRKAAVAIATVVILFAIAGLAYYNYSRRTGAAINSVAVLPFQNASGDPTTEYLSDGIPEALINSLTELQQLRVVARSTAFRYKGKDVDPQQIGRELGVKSVLMGHMRQAGDALDIQVDLVDADTGAQLWGQEFQGKASDLLTMKQTIARTVTEKLRLRLTGEDERRLAKRDTTKPEAYQAYMQGRYYWNKRTGEGLKKSVEYFQQAVDLDPTYALAYSGLADAYTTLPGYSATPAEEVAPKAKAAAAKAIDLDPNLAEAHASLGDIMLSFDSDRAGAEREFQRAIELNPNYPTAHHWYALLLGTSGRNDEAKREILRAQQLDPLSLIINRTVGNVFFWARQYDQAIEQFKKTIEIDPNFPPAHEDLAMTYVIKGRYKEATEEMTKAIALNGRLPHYAAELGYIHSISGNKGEAQKVLDELHLRAKTEDVSPYDLALVYAGLGDKEKAFEMLEEAVRKRVRGTSVGLRLGRSWDGLRTDPRFADLLRRAELPQ